MLRSSIEYYYLLYIFKEIFIYLLGLSAAHVEKEMATHSLHGSQRVGHDWSDLVCTQALRHVGSSLFIAAYRIFRYSTWTLSCSIWDLVPWPGTVPRPTTLGTWSLAIGPPGKSWASHIYTQRKLGNIIWLCAQQEEETTLRISN